MATTEEIFYNLLKIGLFGPSESAPEIDTTGADWAAIYDFAVKQTVTPIIADGISTIGCQIPAKEESMKFVMSILREEQNNKAKDKLSAKLFKLLADNQIEAKLLKGQGVARTYMIPSHRVSGDLDILVSVEDYDRAKAILKPLGRLFKEQEDDGVYVLEVYMGNILVELHGMLGEVAGPRSADKVAAWAKSYNSAPAPQWIEDGVNIPLPAYNFDAVFIFLHLYHHCYTSGVGLRQVCDWARYLYTYHNQIDMNELDKDIKLLKISNGWKTFASIAVDWLGCPPEFIPYYDSKNHNKAAIVIDEIEKNGNFGHYADRKISGPSLERKYNSFLFYLKGYTRYAKAFGGEATRFFSYQIVNGIKNIFGK